MISKVYESTEMTFKSHVEMRRRLVLPTPRNWFIGCPRFNDRILQAPSFPARFAHRDLRLRGCAIVGIIYRANVLTTVDVGLAGDRRRIETGGHEAYPSRLLGYVA